MPFLFRILGMCMIGEAAALMTSPPVAAVGAAPHRMAPRPMPAFPSRTSCVSKMVLKEDEIDTAKSEEDERREAALARLGRIRLLNNIALINGVVIASVALSIGYELFATDLRAIAALFYFDRACTLPVGRIALSPCD